MQEIPFGELHWREAVDAYRRYRKGRHPTSLNFGDCMTYAVAALAGEPIVLPPVGVGRTPLVELAERLPGMSDEELRAAFAAPVPSSE
ncbi:MAG: type II toxin-antitoxin system VapC family toxin [Gemmatimonadetes bacterium]|nr:type II toxin-antitoxin system VapC family toxin [Gemmatimonadota bacterium]